MEIGTKASGTEGKKVMNVATDITIVDTVSYQNLNVGKSYTVKGVLMDKETGEPILVDGEQVTAEKQFTAADESGAVEMEFTFNAVPVKGKKVVVFEELYEDTVKVAVHADIEDEGQTVEFTEPKIGTTAKIEEEKDALISPETTLVDTVEYENLFVGKEYTVKGVLMDKETGEPILVDGEQVTAETVFTAESASGTVDVTFSFSSLELKGKSVVVFETVYESDAEVAVHADIEDEGQTVRFREPEIGTTAAAPNGDKNLKPHSEITIVDVVSYTDLKPGKEYTLKGVLMDKKTGAPLLMNGEQVTAETVFTPDTESGSVDVIFTFDASELDGKSVVVFEDLYNGEILMATHADIEDEGQTVRFRTPPIVKTGVDTFPMGAAIVITCGMFALCGIAAFFFFNCRKKLKNKK